MTDFNDDELKILHEEKRYIMKNLSAALLRHIIAHTLMEGKLHGYGIMKAVNDYYQDSITRGIINKIPTSRIYTVLNKMEDNGQISSEEGHNNNMRVKYYALTPLGEKIYKRINEDLKKGKEEPIWAELLAELD